ncbi:MAG: hypothetical protein LZF86_80060 [Nitrospira sp.]|nr:MAG: hypothetical protein LZF86_80060 [Nitrospira sp.]
MCVAQALVLQLDDKVIDRLKKRTKKHGWSLQSEVQTILEDAVPDYEGAWKRIEGLRKRLRKSGRTFSVRDLPSFVIFSAPDLNHDLRLLY